MFRNFLSNLSLVTKTELKSPTVQYLDDSKRIVFSYTQNLVGKPLILERPATSTAVKTGFGGNLNKTTSPVVRISKRNLTNFIRDVCYIFSSSWINSNLNTCSKIILYRKNENVINKNVICNNKNVIWYLEFKYKQKIILHYFLQNIFLINKGNISFVQLNSLQKLVFWLSMRALNLTDVRFGQQRKLWKLYLTVMVFSQESIRVEHNSSFKDTLLFTL